MSTKRKSTQVEEASPKPKRRLSTVAKKRNRDDSDDEKPATAVKASRKKAAVDPVVEEVVAAPTPSKRNTAKNVEVTSPTKTPRKSRNSLSSQFWLESMQLTSGAGQVKSSTPAPVKEAVTVETPSTSAEQFASPARNFLPSPDVTGSRWSARYEVVIEDEENDGKICFWKHACSTLHIAMAVVTPVFVSMIFLSYVVAAVLTNHTVAVASMGITFCMVLVLIFSSYTLAVFPSIYVTRLFTSLVMTPNDSNATKWPWQWKRNLNFYSTFTALCVLALMSIVIIFSI